MDQCNVRARTEQTGSTKYPEHFGFDRMKGFMTCARGLWTFGGPGIIRDGSDVEDSAAVSELPCCGGGGSGTGSTGTSEDGPICPWSSICSLVASSCLIGRIIHRTLP